VNCDDLAEEGNRMNGTLAAADLELLRKDFAANPVYRLAQNAVTRVSVDDVAINREIVNSIDHSLSTHLDDWKVTNQERSGRCWLFAGLNLLRVGVMRKTGLKDFEFSQNHAMFWDKIERANYFLEAIIATAASGTCSRPSWPSTAWCRRGTCRRRRARPTPRG
jgi:bleomycin hydrolase